MDTLRKFRRLWADERGAASAEIVLAVPLLLLLLLVIAQFTLWLHATHVAQTAASQGLAATRVAGGTAAGGETEAARVLRGLGSGPLQGPQTTVSRTVNVATVRVEGTVTAVVPFLTLTATGEASGPVERFVPEVYGFAKSGAVPGNVGGGDR
jgi:Flp pilus assembly protein TadG